MPGIVGLITKKPREWAEPQLLRMLEAIRHESFYQTGTWIDEELGIYVAWTAIEGSFGSGMPLKNETGDVCLIFSGEEYPDPATYQGNGSQAVSYLVKLYEEDPKFPSSLNGMFHGLVVDRKRGTSLLFNDRYGMRRVYYHEAKDAFYFGAEAKAILAVRPDLRTADPRSIGEFVACSCVLENRTIFKDIYTLPQGSAWVFRNGSIEQKNSYFEPREWEQQEPLGAEAYYQELKGALARNLPRYFNGSQRIGVALTGGLDTRVIMAWHQPAAGALPCYTFNGMYRDNHDVRIARKLAKMCGQSHEVITVGDEFLKNFGHYADRSIYLTEGGVDVYRASDLYVSEKARHIAPVKVVGTYGSEIVRHAVMFKPMMPRAGMYLPEFHSHIDQAKATYLEQRRTHPVTFAAFRQSPWYHYGILGLEQTQLNVRSPYLDNDFVKAVYRGPIELGSTNDDVRLRLIRDGSSLLSRIPSDRGVGGSSLLQGILEFSFKAEYAYDYGMPQFVSRVDHFLSPLHLERLFLGRHKLLHFRYWYRNQLSDYVRQMLLDSKTLSRPYLDRKGVEGMVTGHLQGGLNFTTEIHKLLTLEILQRRFFDPQ